MGATKPAKPATKPAKPATKPGKPATKPTVKVVHPPMIHHAPTTQPLPRVQTVHDIHVFLFNKLKALASHLTNTAYTHAKTTTTEVATLSKASTIKALTIVRPVRAKIL